MKELFKEIKNTNYGVLNNIIKEIIEKIDRIGCYEKSKNELLEEFILVYNAHPSTGKLNFLNTIALKSFSEIPIPDLNIKNSPSLFFNWTEPRESLTKINITNKKRIRENPKLLSLIKPPLWPVSGQLNVCGVTFIASSDFEEKIFKKKLKIEEREVAWQISSEMEHDVWGSIYYQISNSTELEMNPFFSLFNCYTQGLFPLGIRDDVFYYFTW